MRLLWSICYWQINAETYLYPLINMNINVTYYYKAIRCVCVNRILHYFLCPFLNCDCQKGACSNKKSVSLYPLLVLFYCRNWLFPFGSRTGADIIEHAATIDGNWDFCWISAQYSWEKLAIYAPYTLTIDRHNSLFANVTVKRAKVVPILSVRHGKAWR